MRRAVLALACAAALAAAGQVTPGNDVQWVHLQAVTQATVPTGKATAIPLAFTVDADKHINSNKPTSELLIATKLKLEAPTDVSVAAVQYPAGHDFAFSFAPEDKLNVYTGTFQVTASLLAAKKAPLGVQRIHGELTYQACNDRACYPPKRLPVAFDVRIVPGPGAGRRNPPQSPHIHN